MGKMAFLFLADEQRELIERLKANGAGEDAILAAQAQLAEIEMKYNRSLAQLPPTPWRGTGQPPKTKGEKRAAIQAWDSMNEFDRPAMAEWLENNFGIAPNGDLAVAESTFHGWRNLKKP